MRTHYADDPLKSGRPIFNIWTPIAVAVLSILLALVVVARTV
jgi:hypothetical protein